MSGRKSSSLGITEPNDDFDVAGIKTHAHLENYSYEFNGSKTFITEGGASDFFVIGTQTGGDGLANRYINPTYIGVYRGKPSSRLIG